jgi:hypothetical protein
LDINSKVAVNLVPLYAYARSLGLWTIVLFAVLHRPASEDFPKLISGAK